VSEAAVATEARIAARADGQRPGWLQGLVAHRTVVVGAAILLVILAVALLADVIATHVPTRLAPASRLQPPSATNYLGTDEFGRDVFSLVVHGARVSLLVGMTTMLLASLGGVGIGLVAGYYRRLDMVVMRVMEGFMAFPAILLAIALMAVRGPGVANVIFALSVVYTPRTAMLIRSIVLSLREQDYVQAARALGRADAAIAVRHILPTCLAPVLVQASFVFAYAILAEAILGFLGVGVPPYVPSWGNVIASGKNVIREAFWVSLFPGLALTVAGLSLNLLGDGLRDTLDPRLRGRSRQGGSDERDRSLLHARHRARHDDPRQAALTGRADSRRPRTHRAREPDAERVLHPHGRHRAGARARCGSRGHGWWPPRPAARHPVFDQGSRVHPRRAHDVRLSHLRHARARRGRAVRATSRGRRRRDARQDDEPGIRLEGARRQPPHRHHAQPLEHGDDDGRLQCGRRRRGGRRPGTAGPRLRRRRVDPHPVVVLWRVRT